MIAYDRNLQICEDINILVQLTFSKWKTIRRLYELLGFKVV